MAGSPAIPVVHAVPLEPRRPLNLNVAVVALGLVLSLGGVARFLLLFAAVLVLDGRLRPFRLARRAFGAVGDACRWVARCLPAPPAEVAEAVRPPSSLIELAAQFLGEIADEILGEFVDE